MSKESKEGLQIQFTLFKDSSGRQNVLVLNKDTNTFLSVEVSYDNEITGRNYKDIKNAYMIFMIDCNKAYKEAKSKKKFQNKKNSVCFKDYQMLWKNASQEVKDVYEQVFNNFKETKGSNDPFRYVSYYQSENGICPTTNYLPRSSNETPETLETARNIQLGNKIILIIFLTTFI